MKVADHNGYGMLMMSRLHSNGNLQEEQNTFHSDGFLYGVNEVYSVLADWDVSMEDFWRFFFSPYGSS